jgi:DNA repair protein RecN (Recombination protein N)
MLHELHIDNFAIIDHLDLSLSPGLITFTGETGAGKSIIVDALETLLGERADVNLIRSGSERAQIEGVFKIPDSLQSTVQSILEREELLDDLVWITLGREIRANGRSIARINGRSVSLSLLREIGEYLVDVHGQSEHLTLLHVNQHLVLLDRYVVSELSGNSSDKSARVKYPSPENKTTEEIPLHQVFSSYQSTYKLLNATNQQLEKLRLTERDAARRIDTLKFQIQEIESSHLRVGEETELKEEHTRLVNSESLASLSQEALQLLDEGAPEAPAVSDQLGQITHILSNLMRIDASQGYLHEQVQSIFSTITDLSRNLRNYLDEIEFNPKKLDQVEDRLSLIHTLKRKYGDSVEIILQYALQARIELESIAHVEERIQELEIEKENLLTRLSQEGQLLSRKRHAAAENLSKGIEIELIDLQMSGARFQVDFQVQTDPNGVLLEDGRRVAYSINGLERVEFLIAPNPGEGFKPLTKIASGGETSRLMLAIKNVLARADEIPTLVFDEIDQGIGGRVGNVVGEKLWKLAQRHQVLCITHLPQLAVFSELHFGVQKDVNEGRTTTHVKSLEGQERLVELALMMGDVNEGTLQTARELLAYSLKHTSNPDSTSNHA